MVRLRAGFFEEFAGGRDDDGVSRDEQSGFAEGGVVDLGGVDGEGLLGGGLEGVFEGGEGFGQVFREGGGDGFDVCEADLYGGGGGVSLVMGASRSEAGGR